MSANVIPLPASTQCAHCGDCDWYGRPRRSRLDAVLDAENHNKDRHSPSETYRRLAEGCHRANLIPNPTKETPMRTKEQITREVELAQARLERLIDELEAANRLPAEPEDGSVIRFQVQFRPHDTIYDYAAIRVVNSWFTTGTKGGHAGLSWTGLLNLMGEDVRVQASTRRLQFIRMVDYDTVKADK